MPYILMPFMFEPGREALFKLTILSDDRDDDGLVGDMPRGAQAAQRLTDPLPVIDSACC